MSGPTKTHWGLLLFAYGLVTTCLAALPGADVVRSMIAMRVGVVWILAGAFLVFKPKKGTP